MSRVDEAMRRAAGVADVPPLGRTLFPVELRPVPPLQPVPPLETPPPPATAPQSLLERIDPRLQQKVVVDRHVHPISREQYRRLAASLHHANAAAGTKVVMISSALPGEGKTLTASNLAMTFSESYHRNVLLIDADLRKPGLHRVFGADNSFGLAEALSTPIERKIAVQHLSPRLALLAAGHPSSDPMAALTSDRMRRIIEEARESFDWVVIDTPPVGLMSDANLLARMVDTAVLVVMAGSTPFDLVQRAIDAIGREKAFGVVLNRADPRDDTTGYAYYRKYYPSSNGSSR